MEVYIDDAWGTICDEEWDEIDARVVCRQLDFSGSISAISGAAGRTTFGRGSGRIHFSKVRCNGLEENIFDCEYQEDNGCSHDNDAGVICADDDYPEYLVTPTKKPPMKARGKGTNWSDVLVSIIFPAAILFAVYLIYRRLYSGETPPPTPNRTRSTQRQSSLRTEQYRVVPAPYGTMNDANAPTDPDAPPPYDQVISERIKESLPIVTVSRDDMEPTVVFTPTTPSDDDTVPLSADEDMRSSRV